MNSDSKTTENLGFMVVITGASGAGKDAVKDGVFAHPDFASLNIKNIITCTDRPPRLSANPPEIPGVSYHFVTPERLREMEKNGELVENITATGNSFKATPKSEVAKLLMGVNLLWRVDPSRAAEVAEGKFFSRLFPRHADMLTEKTLVVCITAPKKEIANRRKKRDGINFNSKEYELRDNQEAPFLKILSKKAIIIENSEGKIYQAIEEAVKVISESYAKYKESKK